VTSTICPYCGVGCNLDLHVQDNTIVKVTLPLDSEVTHGHPCPLRLRIRPAPPP
jgi:predicted molibdopterin-dependent oxidoreductase YjgC